ncbi:MAG: hypothetical protein GF334_09460 [Candidatus Altiarchaeales archaeon]|nr:hypothetical protein [Candidatus Altiarchaeales archaeon]
MTALHKNLLTTLLCMLFCINAMALDFRVFFDWVADYFEVLNGSWGKVGEVEFTTTTSTTSIPSTTVKDNWRLIEARETGNHSLCEAIESSRLSDLCFTDLALKSNNTHYCTRIKDGMKKDGCFRDLALKLSNDVYCTLIEDADIKGGCLDETPSKVCLSCRG